MVKNTTSAKKVAKVPTVSITSQETITSPVNTIASREKIIEQIFEDVKKDLEEDVPESRDDTTLCQFVIQSVKKYFDKPIDDYAEMEWTPKKVWQAVIQKIIKFRNTTRKTFNQRKIKQKKVKESFRIKRFYMCLHYWRDKRYIYIV